VRHRVEQRAEYGRPRCLEVRQQFRFCPAPIVSVFDGAKAEEHAIGQWIDELLDEGVHPQEIAVLVRPPGWIGRARAAVKASGAMATDMSDTGEISEGHVAVSTMHLANGLEFRAVVVMACDEDVLPLEERIESVGDDADLGGVYNTERHLLCVACTRARDHLLVKGVAAASEFLADFGSVSV
jgi:superfamily I DNA/RNA helicase